MCVEYKRRYDALEEELKQHLMEGVRNAAQPLLYAMRDAGLDPITTMAGLGLALRMMREQEDQENNAIVDDLLERAWKKVAADYLKHKGVVLRPKKHKPMEFKTVGEERLAPDADDRPARDRPFALRRLRSH